MCRVPGVYTAWVVRGAVLSPGPLYPRVFPDLPESKPGLPREGNSALCTLPCPALLDYPALGASLSPGHLPRSRAGLKAG